MTISTAWGFEVNHSESGLTIGFVARQLSTANAEGDYWNETAGEWQASQPSYSDQKFATATENASIPGHYTATHGAFDAAFSGRMKVLAVDEGNGNAVLHSWNVEVIDGLPTVQTVADIAGTAFNASTDALDTIGAVTEKLDDTLEDDGGTFRFSTNALEQGPSSSGGSLANIEQETIPEHRTWTVVNSENGLIDTTILGIQAGESKMFAVDFVNDVGSSRVQSITSVDTEAATGDISFAFDSGNGGVDHSQAKFTVTAASSVTTGQHTIRVKVQYTTGDNVEGDVYIKVSS